MCLNLVKTLDLLLANFGVVDFEDVDWVFVVETVLVDADDGLASGVDAGLCARRGFFDAELGKSGFDSFCHTAELFDFLDVFPCAVGYLVGEGFDVV